VDPRTVALVTAAEYQHLDEDLPLLVAALSDLGIEAVLADWHDDAFPWDGFDLAVLRSPWDYTSQVEAFLATLARIDAATTLCNPLPVVRANAEKGYLVALAEAGVPVVPTEVLRPGDAVALPDGVPFVVKPTVSAGARDTERYAAGDHGPARAHAAGLLAAGRGVLVQPYVEAIDGAGETGLVYLGDRLSHAFRKGPILTPDSRFVDGLYREEDISARQPSAAEIAVAEQALDAVGTIFPGYSRTDLLYARVDIAPGPDGPVVMELELIEPSLFLTVTDVGATNAATAIAARLG
jgi:glutathione synthase/RimK-type ligase-like ATP-grasp enzyme